MRFQFWPSAFQYLGYPARRRRVKPAIRRRSPLARILQRAWFATLLLLLLTVIGTIGFLIIGHGEASFSDALYMTLITISTVGYGEVVPLHGIGGRLFAGLVALIGFGGVTFLFSSLTFFFFENDFDTNLRRHRMQKQIDRLHDHFIICGYGRVGQNVGAELKITGRPYVALDPDQARLLDLAEREPELIWLHGDASDDELLLDARIECAKGLFAVSNDDARNMVITLSAKQLNPAIRVVARCHDERNEAKLRKAGADQVILPDFTGGLRIVGMMIRPTVEHFMQEMMRSDNRIRMEEILVPEDFVARALETLGERAPDYILIAVRAGEDWHFNPQPSFMLRPGYVVMVLTNPAGRRQLERFFD